jgi:GT2 family glycosyltransferase
MIATTPVANPLCTVIIVTWNRRRELEAALDSVFAQSIAPRLEVIVVDNASQDGTVDWLANEYPHPVRLYAYDRNAGASHGRNAAIRLARAPHVAFLDSDALLLEPMAIERCLAALAANPGVRACGGRIWFDRARTRVFTFGGYITPDGHFCGPRTRTRDDDPDFLSTCFSVWETALLRELRGFDSWYFWGIEDMDLALRARWNARRGRTTAASRFLVVEGADALHEMAAGGRHYQPGDFHRVFHAIERQRLYLVLAYGGVLEFFRVLLRTPLRLDRVERDAWEQPLGWRKRLWCAVLYPLNRLARLPMDLWHQRRDHLATTPMPREVQPRR